MAGEMMLHSDLNCFYASVEMNENPYLRGKAVAVCGSTEDRHGIVPTASYLDISDKTVYARIKKMDGEFVLKKGRVYRAEDAG